MARRTSHLLALATCAALALLLGACADDDDAAGDGAGSGATTAPEDAGPEGEDDSGPTTTQDAGDLAEAGPFPVGVRTLELDAGPLVEVWYPAVEGTVGEVTYDVRDFTPDAIRDLLTGDAQATFTIDGARDADVADASFPVVLFSHGFTGIRVQSSYLTSHLASHGMIVVAPDHPSRDLTNVLGGTASGDGEEAIGDLLGALDLIVAADGVAGGPFEGRVDVDRVAALGHSAGGGTVLGAAFDERIAGYVSMAAGGPDDPADYPDRPSLFMAGSVDEVVPAAERTRPAFEAAPTPTWYWEIEAVGHNGFDDFCSFGDGTGIIGVADASGLGGLLDAQPQLRRLGEDGCVPPAAPVEQAFPIVRQGVTAWLWWLFGEGDEPLGFDGSAGEAHDLAVIIEAR